jgi:RimJ/RimL family protein N-acetyltransferase
MAASGDAEQLLGLFARLDRDTHFMIMTPGERNTSVDQQAAKIADISEQANCALFVAEKGTALVGFVGVTGGRFNKNRHCASLALGVTRAHWRRGIGSMLVGKVENWARDHEIRRLELSVMTTNMPAIGFYDRHRFVVEGLKRGSIRVKHTFHDEYLMAKHLDA